MAAENDSSVCKFYENAFEKCGSYSKTDNRLYAFEVVQKNVSEQNFKVQCIMNEIKLIESRSNTKLSQGDLLCPKHKNRLGLHCTPNKKCYHPLHSPKQKNRKRKIA